MQNQDQSSRGQENVSCPEGGRAGTVHISGVIPLSFPTLELEFTELRKTGAAVFPTARAVRFERHMSPLFWKGHTCWHSLVGGSGSPSISLQSNELMKLVET